MANQTLHAAESAPNKIGTSPAMMTATVIAFGRIAQHNAARVALHEQFGFEKVAHYKDVGRKFGQ